MRFSRQMRAKLSRNWISQVKPDADIVNRVSKTEIIFLLDSQPFTDLKKIEQGVNEQ